MQSSPSDLACAVKEKQTRRDRFLAEVGAVTLWSALEAEIEPFYPKGAAAAGRRSGLRMHVAQQCFGLSDEGIEDAIYDSQAIRAFVGIDLAPGGSAGRDHAVEVSPLAGDARAHAQDLRGDQDALGRERFDDP